MRVSLKKRAANRRNAQKSTGPKTELGRHISAQNATRHGLSVPLPQYLINLIVEELAELIMRDGVEQLTAYDLAEMIVEYERNLLFLREIIIDNKDVKISQRYFKRSSNQLIKALRRL
jgi:hypothetical protein